MDFTPHRRKDPIHLANFAWRIEVDLDLSGDATHVDKEAAVLRMAGLEGSGCLRVVELNGELVVGLSASHFVLGDLLTKVPSDQFVRCAFGSFPKDLEW